MINMERTYKHMEMNDLEEEEVYQRESYKVPTQHMRIGQERSVMAEMENADVFYFNEFRQVLVDHQYTQERRDQFFKRKSKPLN